MDFLGQITPILISWNEEANLPRVLGRLGWAQDILVVDSGSTDRTLQILASTPTVRVLTRPFSTFSDQWNFGLEQTTSEWVMTLDADYVLSEGLIEELRVLEPAMDVAGYTCRFRYHALGKALRGSLYPPRTVLFRRTLGTFHEDGHQQRLRLGGRCELLAGAIDHDDRKPLSRWLLAQERYAEIEAQRLLGARLPDLDWMDRIRRAGLLAAPLVMAYSLAVKGCLLDGKPGLYYAFQRGVAEGVLALKLWERRSTLQV
jgi:glycosyltransferase involved in cell wall biosynthesis